MARCSGKGQLTEVNTIDQMVVPGPPGREPRSARAGPPRSLTRTLAVAIVALLVIAVAGVTIPYFALAPGSARQVNDLIRVPAEKAFPPEGTVFLATVSLRQVTPLEALRGWLDPNIDVVPEATILGSTSRGQFTRQNVQLMDDSKQVAVVVALRRLGFPVPEAGKGALVVDVEKGSPADGRLAPGDVVTAVGRVAAPLPERALEQGVGHRPGAAVRLAV